MAIVLIGVSLLTMFGIVTIVLALRGRRIDDHPVCRRCRFDLVGVHPGAEVCPECGRSLDARAVRTGNRRRRKGLLAVGVIALALALFGVAGIVASTLGGAALNPYKPLWMLLSEAKGSDAKRTSDAIDEIEDRLAGNALSDEAIARVVRFSLDRHAHADDPNAPRWIDLIESLRLGDRLSPEQFARYLEQGLAYAVRVRPRIRAGDPLPVETTLTRARIGMQRRVYVHMEIPRVSVDGAPIHLEQAMHLFDIGTQLGSLSGSFASTRTLPIGILTPGEHELRVQVRVRIRHEEGTTRSREAPVASEFERKMAFRFVVSEDDVVTLVAPDDETRRLMRAALTSPSAEVRPISGMNVLVNAESPPMAGVFRLWVRAAADSEWIESETPLSIRPGTRGVMGYELTVRENVDRLAGADRIDLRLVPDPGSARESIDHEAIFGEEIVIEGVPVDRSRE